MRFSISRWLLRRATPCAALTLLAAGAAFAQVECRDEAKVLVASITFPETTLPPDAETKLKESVAGRCFDPTHIEEIRQRLQEGLENLGYLHGKIGEPKMEFVDRASQPKKVALSFPIDEGAQYTVGSVQSEGVINLTPVQMESTIDMQVGEVFDSSKVRRAMGKIRALYDANGYKGTHVTPQIRRDDGDHTVAITFKVEEGEK